jgi:hypothetical protein
MPITACAAKRHPQLGTNGINIIVARVQAVGLTQIKG